MILLNPGPVNVSPRVTAALARGDVCHREPECAELLDRIRARLVTAFAPGGGWRAVLVTGSGTAAVELAVTSACSAQGALVVVSNGVYGERIAAMARAARIPHHVVASPWTEPPDLARVEQALREPGVEAVALVHHETTTGQRNPVAEVGRLARAHGKLFVVDSVSGLAGDALPLDAAGADVVAGTGGKCIQGFPGLSFVLVRESVVPRLLQYPRRSLYLSLANYWEAQERSTTPFTPAVQIAYALDEALAELLEEGVDRRIARYAAAAALLRRGFTRLGLQCILPAERQSNTITALRLPPGHTYATLHDGLKRRGFVIYEGQGRLRDEVFRIANMGQLATADFERCLAALGEVLRA
jgi:2-aminoethylphosphonate-pyruvate transaminase